MSRRSLKVPALVLAIVLGGLAAACAPDNSSTSTGATTVTRPRTPAMLTIVSPEPGSTTGPSVLLRLQLTGATVVSPAQVSGVDPTEGHIHVSVDGKLVSMAFGLTQPLRGLTPGTHTIQAAFVASDHRPFANSVLATVVFTVR
jgi:hypothetical protein